ncbi:hydrogenase expression/formation protein HypE [Paenibacillus thiaminolyticus]|nr:hydrogenase expression/formation protein HypE [Paenibacillus thiaminolyticus]WII35202.1 hydrogenase expression/formation protein HypE [Paenibacillus thiaminolyticus]
MIRGMMHDLRHRLDVSAIARKCHHTVASMILEGVSQARRQFGLSSVVFSGGAWNNRYLQRVTTQLLAQEGFSVYTHKKVLSGDGGIALGQASGHMAVSTDSFVIQPLEFPGGDIGKLAVAGTVNDLAVSGSVPAYLTAGFILEEGLELAVLRRIVQSVANTAMQAGVRIIAGDTKVVERGNCGGMMINTTGIGFVEVPGRIGLRNIQPGDRVVINGGIAEHAVAILAERAGLEFASALRSDCRPLNLVIDQLLGRFHTVRFMRDPTRGRVATSLTEIARSTGLDIIMDEEHIPIQPEVQGALEMMGMDPLYMANEGKVLLFVSEEEAAGLVRCLRAIPGNEMAAEIGSVRAGRGRLLLRTAIGGTRELGMMTGTPLPRIC